VTEYYTNAHLTLDRFEYGLVLTGLVANLG